ncbi:eukaryotic aspartyl protease domain-containing protein [Ditylenchus destructor]|nr:eukaryotic aspartyl protease domain-containing protein [Ditylenchus destructor]
MNSILCLGHFIILLLALEIVTVKLLNGFVHKIPTKIHKLPPEVARQRLDKKYAANPQLAKFLSKLEALNDSSHKQNNTLPLHKWGRTSVANISVGTPPQWLILEVDWQFSLYMELIDSKAKFRDGESNENHLVRQFNSSASLTYSQVDGRYYDAWIDGTGHIGNDIVRVNGQDYNLTFAVLDSVYYPYFDNRGYGLDGVLGLSPGNRSQYATANANLTSTLNQIADQLDGPVITTWMNSSREGDDNGQITLGDLDTDHCESNWMFTPRTESENFVQFSGYTVHLATMEGTWPNGTQQTFKANVDLAILPHGMGLTVEADWVPLFKKISNAVYDSRVMQYVVDCDTTKHGNVTFTIGYGQNNETYNLTITGADYTSYRHVVSMDYKFCYLDVDTRYDDWPVLLGNNFARNHCLVYDMKDDQIGIADSKTTNRNFTDYLDSDSDEYSYD